MAVWKFRNLPSWLCLRWMTDMRQQRGMSMVSILLLLVGAGLLLKAGVGVFSMYWDHKMIGTVLDNMRSASEDRVEIRPNQLRRILQDRLSSNNLNVSLDGLEFRPLQGGVQLDWRYEMRRTWLGNVDLVMTFHQSQEFRQ